MKGDIVAFIFSISRLSCECSFIAQSNVIQRKTKFTLNVFLDRVFDLVWPRANFSQIFLHHFAKLSISAAWREHVGWSREAYFAQGTVLMFIPWPQNKKKCWEVWTQEEAKNSRKRSFCCDSNQTSFNRISSAYRWQLWSRL